MYIITEQPLRKLYEKYTKNIKNKSKWYPKNQPSTSPGGKKRETGMRKRKNKQKNNLENLKPVI